MRRSLRTVAAALIGLAALQSGGCAGIQEFMNKNPEISGIVGGLITAGAAYKLSHGNKAWTAVGFVVGGAATYLISKNFGENAPPEQRQSPAFQQAQAQHDEAVKLQASGQREEAIQHYDQALELSPQPETYNNKGLVYLDENKRDDAETMFREALKLDPTFEPARENLKQMNCPVASLGGLSETLVAAR